MDLQMSTSSLLVSVTRAAGCVEGERWIWKIRNWPWTVALLKRRLLGTVQGAVSRVHLEYYLDKFTFRFNR